MAHGQETGSGKPALRQALQARGLELDLIFGLPSGPAACEPHQRPHTCQHPTTCHTALEDFSCSSRGVHTCRDLIDELGPARCRPSGPFVLSPRGPALDCFAGMTSPLPTRSSLVHGMA